MMRRGVTAVIATAVCGIALIAAMTTAQPTGAVWEDRGGSKLTITAHATAPQPIDAPIIAGGDTVLLSPTAKGYGPGFSGEPTPRDFCFEEAVYSPSGLQSWSITVNTKVAPFNGVSTDNVFAWNTTYMKVVDTATGLITFSPGLNQPTQDATKDKPYWVRFCATNTPLAAVQPPGPTTYTVSTPTFWLNGSQPCVRVVITSVPIYYIGFSVTFDYKAVLDPELAAGRITKAQYDDYLNNLSWGGQDASGSTGAGYQVTLIGYQDLWKVIRASQPVTMKSCSW